MSSNETQDPTKFSKAVQVTLLSLNCLILTSVATYVVFKNHKNLPTLTTLLIVAPCVAQLISCFSSEIALAISVLRTILYLSLNALLVKHLNVYQAYRRSRWLRV